MTSFDEEAPLCRDKDASFEEALSSSRTNRLTKAATYRRPTRRVHYFLAFVLVCAISVYVLLRLNNINGDGIPNLVHFIHLGPDSDALRLDFAHFLAIYSAAFRLKPSRIILHTNLNFHSKSSDRYTRAVKRIPGLTLREVQLRHGTQNGTKFSGGYAHESDFMRVDILKEFGGVYMDTDAFVLRDFAPLRQSKFKNVLGRQATGETGCGLMMASKESRLISAYQALQDAAYDGTWSHHSVFLLDRLSEIFAAVPNEVLVLDSLSLFPFSWTPDRLAALFDPRKGPKQDIALLDAKSKDIEAYIASAIKTVSWDWDKINLSFALHGFFTGLKWVSKEDKVLWFGESAQPSEIYTLQGASYFANAMRPVIIDAITSNVLEGFVDQQP